MIHSWQENLIGEQNAQVAELVDAPASGAGLRM